MRNHADVNFAEVLSKGIADDTPILFGKDEGPGIVVARFYPTRRDFVAGTNSEDLGWIRLADARRIARARGAQLVIF